MDDHPTVTAIIMEKLSPSLKLFMDTNNISIHNDQYAVILTIQRSDNEVGFSPHAMGDFPGKTIAEELIANYRQDIYEANRAIDELTTILEIGTDQAMDKIHD